MERFIADRIKDFEAGRIGRREFCEAVALAFTVYAAGDAAKAAPARRGFTMLGVNHISYNCPNYAQARDWYTSVFGMGVVNDNKMSRANLTFGPEAGKGGTFLVVRNGKTEPDAGATATIDHVCYTVSNWDETKVRAALAAKGLNNPTGRPGSLHVYDPFDYDVQFGNAVEENAFRR